MKYSSILFTVLSMLASSSADNDACGDAETVAVGGTYSGSTIGASVDSIGFYCGTSVAAAGVWYTIEGSANLLLSASTCSYASYDTKINVYSGSCGALSCVGGNDDDWSSGCGSFRSTVTWLSQPGVVYYILVQGFGGDVGNFDLSVSGNLVLSNNTVIDLEEEESNATASVGNDDCENAVIATEGGSYLGSTVDATFDDVDCGAYSIHEGVWYTIIGTGTTLVASTCSFADYDTYLTVMKGSCGGLSCVTINDDFCNLKSGVSWDSVLGEVYFILVHGYSSSNGTFELQFGEANPEKPEFTCKTTGSAPNFLLGGYDVPVDGVNPTGLDMVNNLWHQNLLGKFQVELSPFATFHPFTPSTSIDGDFAFEEHLGEWRGVGVDGNITGSIVDTDEEISDDEGLYIDLGGLAVKEIIFGVRALFLQKFEQPYGPEGGIIIAYFNGSIIDSAHFEAHYLPPPAIGDGQRSWRVVSDVEFDAIGFITKSHYASYPSGSGHDFFVEYLDLCCPPDASIKGDPHVQTWSGAKYDFHGVCDLVLLQNPDFQGGLGMDVHVRTKQLKQFSYVSSAVLRIGDETLEVMGDIHQNLYWINKQPNESLDKGISGYPISYRKVNSKQHEFVVDLGNKRSIVMKTFKKFVRVNFVGATKESFGTSRGLLGSFGSGKMIARDNVTVLEDINAFGQEWQVLPAEGMLFHNVEGPQAPAKCELPVASNLRRRLAQSNISEKEAEIACGRVNGEDFDLCVFDVMATGDKDVVGAY